MFRCIARVAVSVGIVSVSVLASLANAQVSPNTPSPIAAPNPLTTTLSIFRSNMQDKIMKAADTMPEAKYSYRPTKDVRSFAEILNHVADISYFLCSNAKGEAPPAMATGKGSKTEIMAYLKGAFEYCDGVYSSLTDASGLEMVDITQESGRQTRNLRMALLILNFAHNNEIYGNIVTYLRMKDIVPASSEPRPQRQQPR